jgi:hypothetical protein
VKSQGYTRSDIFNGEAYLLLCEVALGTMSIMKQNTWMLYKREHNQQKVSDKLDKEKFNLIQ